MADEQHRRGCRRRQTAQLIGHRTISDDDPPDPRIGVAGPGDGGDEIADQLLRAQACDQYGDEIAR